VQQGVYGHTVEQWRYPVWPHAYLLHGAKDFLRS
jgi:hypothetical protein